tara:strand:+ start:495 stop:1148 length:654 start_codon:yes stop_codon:yes gene_type:complete
MKFWISEPNILIKKENMMEFWPNEKMNLNQKLNAITRLVLLLTILGFLFTQSLSILFSGICTILLITAYYFYKNNQKNNKNLKEGMDDIKNYSENFKPITAKNPLNNVMLHEINGDSNRLSAPPAFNKRIEKNINNATKQSILDINSNHNNLEDKLFKDLGDNYMFDNSMRAFHSNPSTTVPNDQAAFATYCYGNMQSCKDGDTEMCMKHNYRYNNY